MRVRIEKMVRRAVRGGIWTQKWVFVRIFIALQFRCMKVWIQIWIQIDSFSDGIKSADSILNIKILGLIFIFSSPKSCTFIS